MKLIRNLFIAFVIHAILVAIFGELAVTMFLAVIAALVVFEFVKAFNAPTQSPKTDAEPFCPHYISADNKAKSRAQKNSEEKTWKI